MDRGTIEWNDNTSPLSQPVRDDTLSDFSPVAWKLSPCDMESMSVDYFHDEAADAIEMAAFQARHNQFITMTDPLNSLVVNAVYIYGHFFAAYAKYLP